MCQDDLECNTNTCDDGKSGRGLELYVPNVENMWFVRQMQEDPDTMAYNAGWDVSYDGYHPETGCIDLPETMWEKKHAQLVGHEPERFDALVRRREDSQFVGEVNFHYTQDKDWWDMGVLIYAPYRGRGYGRQSLELLLRRAFADCGVSKLHNSFETGCAAGMALHLNAGFERAGKSIGKRFGKEIELEELLLTRERYLLERSTVCLVSDPEEKERIAASVLAELPDWFGLPDSTAEYVACSRGMPFWAAKSNGEVLGFAVLKETAPQTGEIYVMGVRPQYHRSGLGRRLFDALYRGAKDHGYQFLQVKTVREGNYPEYDRTNAFYRSVGFTEFECFPTLWDAWNPCQVFVMAVN